ncbi:MAG TPA: hypothetical protein VGD81_08085 [Opitutaceae bacterium]
MRDSDDDFDDFDGPRRIVLPATAWIIAGLVVILAAWLAPVNLKSVTPALLQAAGRGTSSVATFGGQLLDSEKLGPAALVLETARAIHDPGASALAVRLEREASRQPELVAWGGWDPFLDPLFNLKENTGRSQSTPVLSFFIAERARRSLRDYLSNSRSQGVRAVLATRAIDRTTRFVPAGRAGGQTLDAVILLTALLYQGEHVSPSLQRELRGLAESAQARGELGAIELFYLDLLSLGKRLDWTQLCELMRRADNTKTVSEYAHLGRIDPEALPLIYTAALFSGSADRVAAYLLQFGKAGLEDLRLALASGQGAVRQLLARQVPVNRAPGPALSEIAAIGLVYPRLTLIAKYLGFFAGAFCLFRGLERTVFLRAALGALPRMSSSVLAVLIAAFLIIVTEPYLLKAVPASEYQIRLTVPILASVTDTTSAQPKEPTLAMDTSTLLSIGVFAALQVGMYLLCLVKIGEIARQPVPPLVKLRLAENEENLFDGGLYIGIGGTATALVLQVLGVIEPNLLAAYSSNLFGITCVALVKIRHVRPFKRRLILESQANAPMPPPVFPSAVA